MPRFSGESTRTSTIVLGLGTRGRVREARATVSLVLSTLVFALIALSDAAFAQSSGRERTRDPLMTPGTARSISAIVESNRRLSRVEKTESRLADELSKTRPLLAGAVAVAYPGPLPAQGNALRAHVAELERMLGAYEPARMRGSSGGREHIGRLKSAGNRLTSHLRAICDAATRKERQQLARALLAELDEADPRVRFEREHANRPTLQYEIRPDPPNAAEGRKPARPTSRPP